jgi:hypothetical protein
MKFVCPNCGRKDVVIGDSAPRCLFCRTPLVRATESYADVLMSPTVAIARFETVIGTYGLPAAKQGRFKQEREAWITGVWALGLHEITGKEYWVEIEVLDQTPDCKVHLIDQSTGNNHLMTMNVEVVEWEENRPDVMEVIRQKCDKAYPDYFFLLLLARNGKQIEVPATLEALRKMRVPFAEIWILGRLSEEGTKYGMFMMHPSQRFVEFDLTDALRKNDEQLEFLKRLQRGTGTEMVNLGKLYLPLPQ